VTSLKVIVTDASQISVPVAVPVFAGKVLAEHWMVTFGGQVIDGGTSSLMVMSCVHVLELPQSSVAIQVRVIAVSCGHPAPCVLSVKVIVAVASQLSVAVATPVLAGWVIALQSMVMFGGQDIFGGVLSSTIIV
jgi:hypothetical protein